MISPLLVSRVKGRVGPKLQAVERSLVDWLAGCPDPLRQPAINVFESGGKRLRPLLHLLASDVAGYAGERDVLYATAVEYVHVASLLHDDVIDEAVLRRGRPTINRRYGQTLTVLVGDYLCIKAMALAIEAGDRDVLSLISRTTLDLVEGEALQEAASGRLDLTLEDYLRVVELKTGRLMACACESAALLCADGEDDTLRQKFREYGLKLGLAFQLADDILDYASDEETLGKPVLSDLKEGTLTYPALHALKERGDEARAQFAAVVEDGGFKRVPASDVMALVRDTGGLEAARQLATDAAASARAALDGLPDGPSLEALRFATEYAVTRRY